MLLDEPAPIPAQLLIAAKMPLIEHPVVRHLLQGDLLAALGKALHLPVLVVEKGMGHGGLPDPPPKGCRSHVVVLPEGGAVVGRAVPHIRPDLRYGAFLLHL